MDPTTIAHNMEGLTDMLMTLLRRRLRLLIRRMYSKQVLRRSQRANLWTREMVKHLLKRRNRNLKEFQRVSLMLQKHPPNCQRNILSNHLKKKLRRLRMPTWLTASTPRLVQREKR
jgi:hypothetical protein